MIEYQPQVIQQHAKYLYDRAKTIVVLYTIIFALAGISVGYITSLALDQSGFLAIVAALALGLCGFMVGRMKSFEFRLKAQTALCQMQIEENTRA